MLSLMSVMSSSHALCNPSVCMVLKICSLGVFCFMGELCFLNCDDICMCVVNKQVRLLEFVFDSIYVELHYDEISLTFTAGSVCLCGLCSHVVVICLSVRLPSYPIWMHVLLLSCMSVC